MKKMILIAAVMLLAATAAAQSTIYTEGGQFLRLAPGTSQMTMTVKMHIESACDRWMFHLELPEGIRPTSVTPLDGTCLTFHGDTLQAPLLVSQDLETVSGFVGINQYWDASTNTIHNGVFKWQPGDYDMMQITFAVAPEFRFSVMFINGIIDSGEDARFFYPININVGYERGDANGDGAVTISDVAAIIDHLLGGPLNEFQAEAADVNTDGEISIGDISSLLDVISAQE